MISLLTTFVDTNQDSDLATFFKTYVPSAKPGDDKISKFVGDPDQQEPGIEASLDIQYIMGVAPHVQSEFWLCVVVVVVVVACGRILPALSLLLSVVVAVAVVVEVVVVFLVCEHSHSLLPTRPLHPPSNMARATATMGAPCR